MPRSFVWFSRRGLLAIFAHSFILLLIIPSFLDPPVVPLSIRRRMPRIIGPLFDNLKLSSHISLSQVFPAILGWLGPGDALIDVYPV